MGSLKRTALYPLYEKYGAKTIDFGGWELPVQFSSIKEEHEAVRTKAGLFDVSHMGEVSVTGADALAFLQKLLTNDVAKLVDGKVMYTLMCYPDGGTVDDLLIYKKGTDNYLLVINAANIDKDVEWMQKHVEGDVQVHNISAEIAQLAVQGPKSEYILQKLTKEVLSEISFFHFKEDIDLAGVKALVSRTGYTGEDGFEIYLPAEQAGILWEKILAAGEENILPCGLGARDTLRFEACLPLYGQEISADVTPVEAGLGFAVKTEKSEDFIGKEVLKEQKEHGPPRKLVGIEMLERGIPRHTYPVLSNGKKIGSVTTGTQSPTLKKNIGLVLIESNFAQLGEELQIQIRNKQLIAQIVPIPFYKRQKKQRK